MALLLRIGGERQEIFTLDLNQIKHYIDRKIVVMSTGKILAEYEHIQSIAHNIHFLYRTRTNTERTFPSHH